MTNVLPERLLVWEEGSLRALLPSIAVALLCAACGASDLDARRARLGAERRALEATLDHLEDRLLVNQARVRFWKEMQARHESVTAVACASQEEHAIEMARHVLPDEPARRAGRRASIDRARVAAAPRAAPAPARAAPTP
ncbi:hypothetical protein ACOQFB_07480 [Anaeromyxobacter sp. Red801]|uniref:hypothetical protein n=1 Tax=Anaeromyxobacter sp. Red801 TaxID=3411632 RepID=UPI003BA08E85